MSLPIHPPSIRRPSIRRPTVPLRPVAFAGLGILTAVALVVVGMNALPAAPVSAESSEAPTSTAAVERRTLGTQEEFDGTLGYDGQLSIVNQLATSGAADITALSQAVVAAQAAYDNAVRTLEAIRSPTAANIAAAQAQVRAAESALLSAQIAAKGSTQSQLDAAAAQVAQAQAALATAKAAANGPSASQLAQAQAQLAQAKAALLTAQNAAAGPTTAQRTQAEAAVSQAQIALAADNAALDAARTALTTCQNAGGTPPPDCSSLQSAVTQAEARLASDQQTLAVAQAQLAALTSPEAQSEAQAALASAQAQVTTAQAALDELTSPDATANAQTQLAAAEAAARSAQAALDELTSPDAEAQRKAQVATAKAQLQSAKASLAAILHPTAASTAEAKSNVTVTKANLDAAKAKLDELRGTVTWLPDAGSVVERGEPLYELDGQPSGILLYGERPAWRAMQEGIDGKDVEQLQQNLVALGFDEGLEVNGTFDAATTAAVKAWQQSLGREATGVVAMGDVVFEPDAIRVAAQAVAVGDTVAAGMAVLSASTTQRVVTVDLDADQQSLVSVGDAVDTDLPDGTTATGTVSDVGTVAVAGDNGGSATIEVTVVLDDATSSGAVDQAPVSVLITTFERENVLAVPVNALLALLEGGYAVEVVGADGTSHLVGVETGVFQDGWVEVDVTSGTLEEGDLVVVPS